MALISAQARRNIRVQLKRRLCMTQANTTSALLGCIAILIAGCATHDEPAPVARPPLRVATAPDYPPLTFKRGDRLVGVEADLAQQLAMELGRPLTFVEREFQQLIPTLLAGDADIIMSGMSITEARRVRVDFTEPYLNNGLLAMMRAKDKEKFDTKEEILSATERIGVKHGTTGDAFVQQRIPDAIRVAFQTPSDAAWELRNHRVSLFIHDGYSIAWLVSENEADFAAMWTPLTEEYLAWAVRRQDADLRHAANAMLARMKEDGTLTNIIRRWLPYMVSPTRG
jgi:ABC-type amino acid transport substrate-binding protein